MARPKKRDVTFYLVKEDVMTFEGVVPPQDDLLTFELGLANGFPYEGRLVIRPPRESPPWWIPWLRTAINDIGQYLNASNAAVLTLKTAERIFAITFGYGRGLMALDAFVRDFGLRVALNVVNPDSLNSVDAKTFEQLTLMTRSQTSRASSLETFRMSTVEDIMKAVTGTPTELETFGSRVTGADAAKVTYVPSLLNLHAKCAQLFEAYQAEHYKERFGFIDDLRVIRDRPQIATLNEALLQRLAAQAFGVIHMAPPEVTDVQDIEQFEFSQCPQERILDLDVEYYCSKIAELGLELSIDAMKKGKVGVTYRGSNEVHYLWSAFDCVVAELPEGDKLFILSGGTWYQIESNFAQRVAIAAENWTRPRDFLPLGTDGEFEKDYNSRASDGNQVHLLDQCFARPAGGRSDIEFCDLLTKGRIVHVKRRTRSSTLSHLFSQGIVSAELFLRDATFRTQICQRLHDLGRDAAIGLIPADRPRSPEWEVVYAIVGVADGASPTSLPFFSQLNFKIAAERLENLGYRVSLRLVPNAPNN